MLSASRLEMAGLCGCLLDPWQVPRFLPADWRLLGPVAACLTPQQVPRFLAPGLSFLTCQVEGGLCHLKHLLQSAPRL